MTLAAVPDAGPLSHLAEIDSLELLSAFDTLLVPETVYKEVETGGGPDRVADLSFELVEADESRGRTEELDAGERAAVAVAEQQGIVLLTDDLAARQAASDAGVEVHGSIGILALGYGRGLLDRDDAASRMRELQRSIHTPSRSVELPSEESPGAFTRQITRGDAAAKRAVPTGQRRRSRRRPLRTMRRRTRRGSRRQALIALRIFPIG